jgi:hypothetical protein
MKGEQKMGIKFELYQEHELLIDQDEVSWVHPAAEWQGNLYGVDGATEDDLLALNALPISDADDVADVAKAVKTATGYNIAGINTGGCAQGEYVDDSHGYIEVVYDHLGKEFLLISEMETEPVYIYWDGSNWKCVWLPEPDAIIEVEEGEEEPYSLDTWDGNNYTYGGVGCHAEYYYIDRLDGEPVDDKVLLRYWSQWQGDQPSGEIVSLEKLEEIKAGE